MKKTLVAMAALAATGAFAQVTITGVLDIGIKAVAAPAKSATDNPSRTDLNGNNTATSAFKFIGNEDIGGGMSAGFLFELDPNVNSITGNTVQAGAAGSAAATGAQNTGSSFSGTPFNGEEFIRLGGSFGEFKLGVPNSLSFLNINQAQPFGTAMGSGNSTSFGRQGTTFGGISGLQGGTAGDRIIRHERTTQYNSPVLGGGFKFSVEYAFGNDGNTSANATTNANTETWTAYGGSYTNGPLYAGLTVATLKFGTNPVNQAFGQSANFGVGALGTTTTYTNAAANYQVRPNITVYGGYTTTKNSDATVEDASSWNVAGKYTMGAIDLMANYLVRTTNLTAGTALGTGAQNTGGNPQPSGNATGRNGKVIGIGADYNLSKRTALTARWEMLDTDTNLGTTANGSVTNSTAVGIRHTF